MPQQSADQKSGAAETQSSTAQETRSANAAKVRPEFYPRNWKKVFRNAKRKLNSEIDLMVIAAEVHDGE